MAPSHVVQRTAKGEATLDRLIQAAEAVLDEEGLDGATVPVIAARANVSVGVVYRYFRDKDDLLRATYDRFFSTATAQNRSALEPERWASVPTKVLVRSLVSGMVAGHRAHPGLIRALLLFATAQKNPEFCARATELGEEGLSLAGELLLRRRKDIGHPKPSMAVAFALRSVASILNGALLSNETHAREAFDEAHTKELVELVLRYLQVQTSVRKAARQRTKSV